MRPLKQFGSPVLDAVGPMPYVQLNGMLDAAYPKGALNYWKSNFLASLSDEAIRTMIDCFAKCPTPMGQLLLEQIAQWLVQTKTPFQGTAEFAYALLLLCEEASLLRYSDDDGSNHDDAKRPECDLYTELVGEKSCN
jgi:hypothetical protein